MILSISVKEFHNNLSDLVTQKGFYPYESMTDFKKFEEPLPSKEKFYSSLTGKKNLVTKNMIMFLRFGTNLK